MNTLTANSSDSKIFVEPPPRTPRLSIDGIVTSLRQVATVSEVLRILGAAVILASMSLFLLQGWHEGNDIRRYLLLLTQTGLLAVGGLALSHGLKEAKGARIFFGLALVSIPANFTILGALVYSVIQWDGALTSYPDYATWQIGDIANIGMTMAGAFAVLLPVSLFCFAIMARQSSKSLALHFVPLNALLLLPVRDSIVAGAIALVGIVYALWVVRRLVTTDPALSTGEGRFALTTLFIPLGIILFRSMYFYDVDSLMVAMLSAGLFLACRQAATYPERHPLVATLLETVSLPLAMVTSLALAASLSGMPDEALAPLTALVYAAMAGDVLRRTDSNILKGFTTFTMCFAIAAGFMLSVVFEPTVITALFAMTAGVGLGLAGSWFDSRSAISAGVLTMLTAISFGVEPVVELVIASSWISLAVLGASAILLGSLLERHGVAIKVKLMQLSQGKKREEGEIVLDD